MYFDFSDPTVGSETHVPMMDNNEAIRRILEILNSQLGAGDGSSQLNGFGGSSLLAGFSFQSIPDVVVGVPGVAKQVPGHPSPRGVLLVADLNNTGVIYVGGSTVNGSSNERGIILTPAGMPSYAIPVATTDRIFIDGTVTGDRVGIVIL